VRPTPALTVALLIAGCFLLGATAAGAPLPYLAGLAVGAGGLAYPLTWRAAGRSREQRRLVRQLRRVLDSHEELKRELAKFPGPEALIRSLNAMSQDINMLKEVTAELRARKQRDGLAEAMNMIKPVGFPEDD
jgi:hypothetical protein